VEYKYGENIELVDKDDWIKVTGRICVDYKVGYLYIDATSVEKMATRGNDTVTN